MTDAQSPQIAAQDVTDLCPKPGEYSFTQGETNNGIQKRLVALDMLKLKSKNYWSFQRVADHWGCDKKTVMNYIKPLLSQTEAFEVEEYREMQITMYEEMIEIHGARMKDPKSAMVVINAQKEIAKLKGLDAPTEHKVTYEDSTTSSINALLDQMDAEDNAKIEALANGDSV